jgi:hypothetical protein
MPIVGGLGIHRKQLTFDYLDTVTGEVQRGQIAPANLSQVGPGDHGRVGSAIQRRRPADVRPS